MLNTFRVIHCLLCHIVSSMNPRIDFEKAVGRICKICSRNIILLPIMSLCFIVMFDPNICLFQDFF